MPAEIAGMNISDMFNQNKKKKVRQDNKSQMKQK